MCAAMTQQPPMQPARRADFANALKEQLGAAARTGDTAGIWRCVKMLEKLCADLDAVALPQATVEELEAGLQGTAAAKEAREAADACRKAHAAFIAAGAPVDIVSPSQKDPGRVEGPGPLPTEAELARIAHDARFYGLSRAQLDARWEHIKGGEEGALYRRLAAAAVQARGARG